MVASVQTPPGGGKRVNQTISVIVPVYNVAQYLSQCVSSILSQDYGDLEVILIDDGSTDASGEICDQYAAKDSRVRVIHQKNGGAAAAKNAGLRLASGDYLVFADSDDYLEPGAYGFLMKTLLETNADAVQGSFREVYQNRAEEQHIRGKEITPFLLAHIKEMTGGESFASNVQLALNNARCAARIAVSLAKMQ